MTGPSSSRRNARFGALGELGGHRFGLGRRRRDSADLAPSIPSAPWRGVHRTGRAGDLGFDRGCDPLGVAGGETR